MIFYDSLLARPRFFSEFLAQSATPRIGRGSLKDLNLSTYIVKEREEAKSQSFIKLSLPFVFSLANK